MHTRWYMLERADGLDQAAIALFHPPDFCSHSSCPNRNAVLINISESGKGVASLAMKCEHLGLVVITNFLTEGPSGY